MKRTSRVLAAVGAVTLMTYGSALAQQPGQQPAQPAPGSTQSSAQTMTATGELTNVDAKADTVTVKTATGDVIIKYNDETKVTGASRNTAGLATMSGSHVVIRYKKDGASNVATAIEVKPAGGAAPGLERPAPGGDPSKPPTPRP